MLLPLRQHCTLLMNTVVLSMRSFAFFAAAFVWTALITVCGTVLLPFRREIAVTYLEYWARGIFLLLRTIVGITYEIRGQEHLDRLRNEKRPTLFVCGHQSAWETIAFHLLVRDPCFFMKQELSRIPFYGWLAQKVGMISIDRGKGSIPVKRLVDVHFPTAIERMRRGQHIIYFPAGTRVPVGKKQVLHPLVFRLYERTRELEHAQTMLVALNSGLCWPRTGPLRPGKITVCLTVVPNGLNRKDFLDHIAEINAIQSFLPGGRCSTVLQDLHTYKTNYRLFSLCS